MPPEDPQDFPLITIGMTSFNAEDTIGRALESALAQEYPNTEIVIVDDCSKDSSRDVIQKYADENAHIKFIKHIENKGFAGALNSIITNASGEFIAIFDDDDISFPSRLSIQKQRIEEYEKETGAEYVACWGSGYREYDNGYKYYFQAIGSQPKIPVGKDLIRCQLYMGRDPKVFFGSGTPSCALMVRKSTYDAVGLYDTTMRRTEDTDFVIRLAKKDGHFIGCPEHIVKQFATIGHDKRPEVGYQSEINLITKHKDLFNPPRRYEYAKDWIKLRYHHFSRHRIQSVLTLIMLLFKYPAWTWEQFWRSAPKRLAHEHKMSQPSA